MLHAGGVAEDSCTPNAARQAQTTPSHPRASESQPRRLRPVSCPAPSSGICGHWSRILRTPPYSPHRSKNTMAERPPSFESEFVYVVGIQFRVLRAVTQGLILNANSKTTSPSLGAKGTPTTNRWLISPRRRVLRVVNWPSQARATEESPPKMRLSKAFPTGSSSF